MLPILPDTPSSVLQLLNANKESLNTFAARIINDVRDGNEDALQIHMLCKKYEFVLDKIKEGIKDNVKTAASSYGEKPFDYAGSEMQYTPTRTEYDFNACGDIKLESLKATMESIQKQIKQREEWLKSMGGPETFLDESTGETYTIYPPIKRTSMGVKVSLK